MVFCLQSQLVLEAVKNGHEETVHLLVKNGAKISMKESLAASILCQAVYDGDITLLRRLVDAGVWVNAADYDKRTGECSDALLLYIFTVISSKVSQG